MIGLQFEFNYHSVRARKARFYVNFNRTLRTVLLFLAVGLATLGVAMWASDNPLFGSFFIGVAATMMLPLVWYEYDIKRMRPFLPDKTAPVIRLEEVMAIDVVGKLQDVGSCYNIWQGLRGTWQQRFFTVRYGISSEYFDSLDKEGGLAPQALEYAVDLSRKHGASSLTAASVLVALLRTLPHHEEILAKRQLDLEELETSIDWIHHNQAIFELIGKTKSFGGLARDWTSGYTPTLNQMAYNITSEVEHAGFWRRDVSSHQRTLDEMVKFMSVGRQNVLLVGEVGVGKTMTAHAFAQRIMTDPQVPENIRFNQMFLINASSIISVSPDPNKVEATVLRIVAEAHKAKNTILFFDDAASFFAEGTGSVNLSQVLLPIVQNGAVPMIFAMTPTEWQNVAVRSPALAGMLNYLAMPATTPDTTLRILEDQSILIESRRGSVITYQALKETIALSDRYVREVAQPGAAINLLENAMNHPQEGVVTAVSVQHSIEATHGVKVQTASNAEKEELLNLEEAIHKRMINQSRAVKVVSDALRRARSGVNNPNKPIGTFLFLGPTGVGKTELSKAVADVYFGDENRMVRVDMNEFTQSSDVARLLDVSSSTSFLSQIGRNRFTVVLFDEIEKAHPEVVNVFLQLLDEGVMRDVNNKAVSFHDAIVIATSNAGANAIRQYIDAGYEVHQFEKEFVSSLIDANLFKPEFLNRFDETVVFRPLKQEELVQIVDLLLRGINANLAKQKVSVDLTVAAKQWLASQGYDPRLGARPLRRMVQRTVENVVAKRILESAFQPGMTLTLDKPELEAEADNAPAH